MTRNVLCGVLAVGSLSLALLTALYQAENRARGAHLNELMEQCHMLEGVTRENAASVLALDWGPLPADAEILLRAKGLKPKAPAKKAGVQP